MIFRLCRAPFEIPKRPIPNRPETMATETAPRKGHKREAANRREELAAEDQPA
jgi:hypothetical protein